MNKKIIFFLFTFFFFTTPVLSAEPTNIYDYYQTISQYYNSGEYVKDIDTQLKQAYQYVDQRIKENKSLPEKSQKKLAVVFDIDGTTLSSYDDVQNMIRDFASNMKNSNENQSKFFSKYSSHALIKKADMPAIPGMVDFYNYVKNKGVTIFFITSRHDSLMSETIKNLKQAGYSDWNELLMKTQPYQKYKSAGPYKALRRKELEDKGYDIIVNIGDQYSDFKGGYFERSFKIPNPISYVP